MTTIPSSMPIREVRALEMLAADARVLRIEGSLTDYLVPSETGRGFYRVHIGAGPEDPETCSCPDFAERLAPCKHIYLVRYDRKAELEDPDPAHPPRLPVPPARPKRDWRAYDEAQTQEYRLFNTLLRDLALGFPEPYKDPHRAGRKPIPMRELAYIAVQRAYLGFSLRRSQDFREESVHKGLISDAHYYALPSHFLCRPEVTEGLRDMLARSAIPLMGIEDRCAVDSTGLRTTRFNYYRQEKYEPERENDWRKLHALVGVKTHVMPVLEVTDGSVHDSHQFPVLLRRAYEYGFRFKEAYADKGYLSRENYNTAMDLGVLPFIPFKKNNTGATKGSPMYHKMFLFFQLERETFDLHYGQRAQVESTFGSWKQKFGETLASRKFDSQVNEVYTLAIAHNITVLVRQMFASGILPDFLRPANPPVVATPLADLPPDLCANRGLTDPAVSLLTAR